MAHFGFATTLTRTLLGVLTLLQLVTAFRIPNSNWKPERAEDDVFLLGAGKADITGPVVELTFMGYANPDQKGSGLRQRLYARSFIIGSPDNPDDTFVYVVLDTAMGDTAIRDGVLQGLESLGGDYAQYGQSNLALTGTHSHSGPGAWLNYLLPQISTLGFDKQSYQAIVDGTLLSIQRAHDSIAPGHLSFGSIDLEDANVNRSPYSYLANPEEERERYTADVDKTLTLLKFDRVEDQKTTAILTFFPVHGTSMLNNNTLVTGDNKGVASYLFERSAEGDSTFADDFVAGFSQSNVGDTSPNVLGAYCEDGSGEKCKFEDSTCGGKTEACHGRGPYFTEKDEGAKSCFEIGRRQYSAARELFDTLGDNSTKVVGSSSVSSFHTFHDLAGYTFVSPFEPSEELTTCYAALGYAFAGGTTDGPGMFDFTQNGTDSPATDNPLWDIARAFIHQPSEEQMECQDPKPILLDVGAVDKPYDWTPNIVDIQVLRVGQLMIIVSPGEATTMAGRRWKEAVADAAAEELSVSDPLVVLGGPANTYTHYITTKEEYGVQRYEGGSTIYGPNTLAAYINLTLTYLPSLEGSSNSVPAGPSPPINTDNSLSFITPVVYDGTPIGKSFGDVVSSPEEDTTYGPGSLVTTTFIGANPRNNLRLESTFTTVEFKAPDSDTWEVVRDDKDWNLVYRWERKDGVLGTSEVTVEWLIEDDFYNLDSPRSLEDGTYRMKYYGDSKSVNGDIEAFEGTGGEFTVSASG
ncbi:hypothetical protein FQN54_009452 [Arachnomyces sp. PD_36]|nr:hypothetical protein FQN54_009452 [Arachnomyces sp. PD_36]